MTTKSQQPQGTRGQTTCRSCGGKGTVTQTKDGKPKKTKCIACRGSGKASGYPTK